MCLIIPPLCGVTEFAGHSFYPSPRPPGCGDVTHWANTPVRKYSHHLLELLVDFGQLVHVSSIQIRRSLREPLPGGSLNLPLTLESIDFSCLQDSLRDQRDQEREHEQEPNRKFVRRVNPPKDY